MQKYVTVVFERKKKVEKTGMGKVELQIRLSEGKRKYVSLMDVQPDQWPDICQRKDVQVEIERYESIRQAMDVLGEPITLEVLNKHLGIISKPKESKKRKRKPIILTEEQKAFFGIRDDDFSDPDESESFLDFMVDCINHEKICMGTLKHKQVVYASIMTFGKLKLMSDLTPTRIREYDQWLRDTGDRTDVTIYGYHKRLHKYVRKAYQLGLIDRDPYEQVTIPRGRSKERKPLTEEELTKLRNLELPPREAKARDLFIFSAYTGLAYADAQLFDFETMTVKHGDMYYIEGSRLKTGTNFYTPIFQPAMGILKKYNYRLPRISNQKLNISLHAIQIIMKLNKPLTSHVARHTFATQALSNDVPIEDVARMLGHTDISTTEIYAKILPTTIERHAEAIKDRMK